MSLFGLQTSPKSKQMPDYGKAYFQHVLATLRSTTNDASPWPDYISVIVNSCREDQSKIDWGQLYLLEKFTLSTQSDDSIKRRAWTMRNEYFELVGAAAYDKYLQSHPPNESDPNCDIESLRADLDRILDSLHWSYSLIPIRERLRTGIVRDIGISVALFAVLDLGLICWCSFYYETLFAALLIAMLAGAVGGFISLQQRVQNIPCDGDPLVSIFEIENGRFSIFQAPVSGAIFALVLLFLFMGGLVSGQLFPEFKGLDLYLHKFQWSGGDLSGPNYAKLIVWCFISGFAERFVPDTLDRLIAKGQDSGKPSTSPGQPAPPFPGQSASPPRPRPAGMFGSSPPSRGRFSPPWR